MQSMNTTYNKKIKNSMILSLETNANPIELTIKKIIKEDYILVSYYLQHNQMANKTRNAGSSLANCDFVSIRKNQLNQYLDKLNDDSNYVFYTENFCILSVAQ